MSDDSDQDNGFDLDINSEYYTDQSES